MPAKSEAQQRFMGMALAAKRSKGHFSDKVEAAAKSMSEKQLRDFAKTKHEGLPEKKASMTTEEQAYINGFIKRANEYGLSELQAIELLKQAGPNQNEAMVQPNQRSYSNAAVAPHAVNPAPPTGVPAVPLEALDSRNRKPAIAPKVMPRVNPAALNDLGRFTPVR
jgi:hypothetical protein